MAGLLCAFRHGVAAAREEANRARQSRVVGHTVYGERFARRVWPHQLGGALCVHSACGQIRQCQGRKLHCEKRQTTRDPSLGLIAGCHVKSRRGAIRAYWCRWGPVWVVGADTSGPTGRCPPPSVARGRRRGVATLCRRDAALAPTRIGESFHFTLSAGDDATPRREGRDVDVLGGTRRRNAVGGREHPVARTPARSAFISCGFLHAPRAASSKCVVVV